MNAIEETLKTATQFISKINESTSLKAEADTLSELATTIEQLQGLIAHPDYKIITMQQKLEILNLLQVAQETNDQLKMKFESHQYSETKRSVTQVIHKDFYPTLYRKPKPFPEAPNETPKVERNNKKPELK